MKIRSGFVSNSSASSFVCDLCGILEVTYDGDGKYGEQVECDNHHTFHRECAEKILGIKIDTDSICEKDDYDGTIPIEFCPICQGKAEINPINEINKHALDEVLTG